MKIPPQLRTIDWPRVSILTLMGTALVASWAFGYFEKDLKSEDWASWVGAVGTILAFVGTIYIAGTETRRREKFERGQVWFALYKLSESLVNRQIAIHSVISWIESEMTFDLLIKSPADAAQRLESGRAWTEEDLAPFITLDNHVAFRLHHAQDIISNASSALSTIEFEGMQRSQIWQMNCYHAQEIAEKLRRAQADIEFAVKRSQEILPKF